MGIGVDTRWPSRMNSHSLIVGGLAVLLLLKSAWSPSFEVGAGPADSDQRPVSHEVRFFTVPARPPVTPRYLNSLR